MRVDQPTAQPTSKVTAGGVGGAATIVLIYLAGMFGIDLPAEVAAALAVLGGFIAAYFTRERA